MLEPHEVEDRQYSLVIRAPEASAELLEEDRRGLRRAQHQDRVNHRDIESLIEEVDSEQAHDLAAPQLREPLLPLVGPRGAAERERGEPGTTEHLGHVMGVLDADAESKRSHSARISDLVSQGLKHLGGSSIVAGVQAVQLVNVVRTAGESQPAEIHTVGDPEVVEWNKQVCAERVPQPQLARHATLEERLGHVHPVGPLRCRGEPKEFSGGVVVEDPSVRRGLGMMELVDDDDVEVVARPSLELAGLLQRLDRGEDMPSPDGLPPVDEQFPERAVLQNVAVGP